MVTPFCGPAAQFQEGPAGPNIFSSAVALCSPCAEGGFPSNLDPQLVVCSESSAEVFLLMDFSTKKVFGFFLSSGNRSRDLKANRTPLNKSSSAKRGAKLPGESGYKDIILGLWQLETKWQLRLFFHVSFQDDFTKAGEMVASCHPKKITSNVFQYLSCWERCCLLLGWR